VPQVRPLGRPQRPERHTVALDQLLEFEEQPRRPRRPLLLGGVGARRVLRQPGQGAACHAKQPAGAQDARGPRAEIEWIGLRLGRVGRLDRLERDAARLVVPPRSVYRDQPFGGAAQHVRALVGTRAVLVEPQVDLGDGACGQRRRARARIEATNQACGQMRWPYPRQRPQGVQADAVVVAAAGKLLPNLTTDRGDGEPTEALGGLDRCNSVGRRQQRDDVEVVDPVDGKLARPRRHDGPVRAPKEPLHLARSGCGDCLLEVDDGRPALDGG
jgi:hypothetical protein